MTKLKYFYCSAFLNILTSSHVFPSRPSSGGKGLLTGPVVKIKKHTDGRMGKKRRRLLFAPEVFETLPGKWTSSIKKCTSVRLSGARSWASCQTKGRWGRVQLQSGLANTWDQGPGHSYGDGQGPSSCLRSLPTDQADLDLSSFLLFSFF